MIEPPPEANTLNELTLLFDFSLDKQLQKSYISAMRRIIIALRY